MIAIGLFFLAYLIFRDVYKTAFYSSIALLVFFSYGQIYRVIKTAKFFLGRHSFLLPLSALLLLFILIIICKSKKDFKNIVGYSNIILLALLLVSLVPVSVELYKYSQYDNKRRDQINALLESGETSEIKPDIYFIILDMYARADVLQEKFDYNNSGFINELKDLGFYVVDCSMSNYHTTMRSVLSTLNYDYYTETPDTNPGQEIFKTNILVDRNDMVNNKVRINLEKHGYKTVAFETGYGFSEWNDADYYFDTNNSKSQLNDFENMLMNSTMVVAYKDYQIKNTSKTEKINWNEYDESLDYRFSVKQDALNTLGNLEELPRPLFVFAHIALPHGPFVFTESGSFTGKDLGEDEGYIPQLEFTNKRISNIFTKIIRDSDIPPIIILESDHGVYGDEPATRMKNLMAYYVPDDIKSKLYPTITPINSFRLVLNYLQYTNLNLLPDYSFYSYSPDASDNFIIPNSCMSTTGKINSPK